MKNKFADELRKKADGCTFGSELMDIADEIEKKCIELPIGADGESIAIGDEVRRTYDKEMETVKSLEFGSDRALVHLSDYTLEKPENLTHEKPYDMEQLLEDLKDVQDSIEENALRMDKAAQWAISSHLSYIIEEGKKING